LKEVVVTGYWIRAVQDFRSMLLAGMFGVSTLHANFAPAQISGPLQRSDRVQIEDSSNQAGWEELAAKGRTLRDQSRYAEAEDCLRSALSAAEEFGSTDPRVAESLNDLATLVQIRGSYNEAESLFRRAVTIWNQHSGDYRLELAVGLCNLANALRLKEQFAEAERLQLQAIDIERAALPPEDPIALETLYGLGAILQGSMRRRVLF
jgi:tetratricopeptide (TPR) repeat protein